MILFNNILNYANHCQLFSFGNRTWFGTPFSSPSYYFVSNKDEKARNKKGKRINFDFEEQFKINVV